MKTLDKGPRFLPLFTPEWESRTMSSHRPPILSVPML